MINILVYDKRDEKGLPAPGAKYVLIECDMGAKPHLNVEAIVRAAVYAVQEGDLG